MLGGLLWLGLDIELPPKADLLFVIDSHLQESAEMIEFAFDIGVPQSRIAFATAPKNIPSPAEFVGDFESFLYLRSRVGKHIRVATCRGPMTITGVYKKTGCPPEELDTGPLLLLLQNFYDCVEILVRLR